jgi:isoleucyl-tRNA synthetase
MHVSDEILKRTADVYRRLRNTARYLLANLAGFDPAKDLLPPEALLPLDRWVIDRAYSLQTEVQEAYATYQFHNVYQRVHHFCSVDLGSFYLDVLKDRQYTCREDSPVRRSGQTAMYHLAEALTRWLAPILSFTAEEIWRHLPGERGESVFLETWYSGLFPLDEKTPYDPTFWDEILGIREQISKSLEGLRSSEAIGSSLDAEVVLTVPSALYKILKPVETDLRFIFINSGTAVLEEESLHSGDVRITAKASEATKCIRCWQHREDVGHHADHPEICGRCADNVAGAGETRTLG